MHQDKLKSFPPFPECTPILIYCGVVFVGILFFYTVEWYYGHEEGFLLLHLLGRGNLWDRFFGIITHFGDGLLLSSIGLWLLLLSRHREKWFWGLVGAVVVGIMVQLLKLVFFSDVPRPLKLVSPIYPIGEHLKEHSFPSGHSSISAYWGLWMAGISSKRWAKIVWSFFPLLVGWSRIYVGAHFPIDVAGGLLIGLIMGSGFFFLASQRRIVLFTNERTYTLFLFLCKFVVIIRAIFLITISSLP